VLHDIFAVIGQVMSFFCFGYPFVMAWYWMAGGLMFYFGRERFMPPPDRPPSLEHWPPISILVPCYNEGENAVETLSQAALVDYPDFEILAINDGSRDNTAEVLDRLSGQIPNLRVIHLAQNGGKARALKAGALMAKHELVVCIDGDALLDPHALRWIARAFRRGDVGGLGGNPRIRNRTTLLGRLQVGEFSSIVGLIRRAQTTYGRLFTVSGVICAFRKRALADAGWWSELTITDDIDITWRVQIAGWRVVFEPNAIVWILMPETLKGLWRQRLRWAEGGAVMMIDFFRPLIASRGFSLLPTYLNNFLGFAWSYSILLSLILGGLWAIGLPLPGGLGQGFGLIPEWWGLVLVVTYLAQALVSHFIERRWYPMAFWVIGTATSIIALPRAIFRKRISTWVSPDRGLR
jgi:biofilm PGA synthesis N-glycosyltransferase PgaC